MRIIEFAPAVAVLLYITWRQDQRIAKLEQAILDLLPQSDKGETK